MPAGWRLRSDQNHLLSGPQKGSKRGPKGVQKWYQGWPGTPKYDPISSGDPPKGVILGHLGVQKGSFWGPQGYQGVLRRVISSRIGSHPWGVRWVLQIAPSKQRFPGSKRGHFGVQKGSFWGSQDPRFDPISSGYHPKRGSLSGTPFDPKRGSFWHPPKPPLAEGPPNRPPTN